ncbi:hypothetical protein [Mycoplasmopsis gallopavonis]|uniref:Uncharacterized protein n=1 Tax=Mycoplasmopsis gallopavonis TaxID=76629 RepID=A0A449AZJ4_9BACT|nr:hypothetical protein [Mycoplasmopsis gallopavonis]RIV16797.1 hypothetical protein D1113_00965 [Mycoplasmopsis gallopavonis]VEU72921.1 Uncharacterised protein [Mycoplasmopsis gallopavonis]
MLKKRKIKFLFGIVNTTFLFIPSCVNTTQNSMKIDTLEKMQLATKQLVNFQPKINLPINQSLQNFTIDDLIANHYINWNIFEQEVIINGKKAKLNGQLLEIEFTTGTNEAIFKYLWTSEFLNDKVPRRYTLQNLKELPYSNEPFCHFGHCHPASNRPTIIIVKNPNIK